MSYKGKNKNNQKIKTEKRKSLNEIIPAFELGDDTVLSETVETDRINHYTDNFKIAFEAAKLAINNHLKDLFTLNAQNSENSASGGFGTIFTLSGKEPLKENKFVLKIMFIRKDPKSKEGVLQSDVDHFEKECKIGLEIHRFAFKNIPGIYPIVGRYPFRITTAGKFTEDRNSSNSFLKINNEELAEYCFVVMEYVANTTIVQCINKYENIKERNNYIIDLFYPLLTELNDLHKKGYCHHDIKPSNIMCLDTKDTEEPKLFLIDYGETLKIDKQIGVGINKVNNNGTPEYAPSDPTIGVLRKANLFGKNYYVNYDIYSVCSTLYYLFTGNRCPVQGIGVSDRAYKKNLKKTVMENLKNSKLDLVQRWIIYRGLLWHQAKWKIKLSTLNENLYLGIKRFAFLLIIVLFLLVTVIVSFMSKTDTAIDMENIFNHSWEDSKLKQSISECFENRYTTEEYCSRIKTMVIDNGKIILNEKEIDDFLKNEYRTDVEGPQFTIESFEDIVEYFPNLTCLAVYNCDIPDKDDDGKELSALGQLNSLTNVSFVGTDIDNLSFFENVQIAQIYPSKEDNIVIRDLSALKQIRDLNIINVENISLYDLQSMRYLNTISLDVNEFDSNDLNYLPDSTKRFYFYDANVDFIMHLDKFTNAEEIYLFNGDFKGAEEELVEKLLSLRTLHTLNLYGSAFNSLDAFEKLSEHPSLVSIDIRDVKDTDGKNFTDYSAFDFCKDLRYTNTYITLDGEILTEKELKKRKYTKVYFYNDNVFFEGDDIVGNYSVDQLSFYKTTSEIQAETISLFPYAEKIYFNYCELSSEVFSAISELTDITDIYFRGCVCEFGDNPIPENLEDVSFREMEIAKSELDWINKIDKLRYLRIKDVDSIDSQLLVEILKNKQHLRELDCLNIDSLSLDGFEQLASCSELKYIGAYGNGIIDWTPISFCENVERWPGLYEDEVIDNLYKTVVIRGGEILFCDGIEQGTLDDGYQMGTYIPPESTYTPYNNVLEIAHFFPEAETLHLEDTTIQGNELSELIALMPNLKTLCITKSHCDINNITGIDKLKVFVDE